MKGPKLGPPNAITFDFKRVHFLTLSGTCLLCTGAQNWTLNMLNPVPPWRCRFKVTEEPSWVTLSYSRIASNYTDQHWNWQQGQTREAPNSVSKKSIHFGRKKTNPLRTFLVQACLNHYLPGCCEVDEQMSNNWALWDSRSFIPDWARPAKPVL